MIRTVVLALALGTACSPARALAQDALDGDWDGALSVPAGIKVPLTLHITDKGSTLDSPDQNARGVPVDVTRHGRQVEVDIPANAIVNGEVHLRLEREAGAGGNGRGPQVSDVWLVRK